MRRTNGVLWIAAILAVSLLAGCASDTEVISDSKQRVIAPEVIEEDDATWTKADGLTESDTNRLKAYFQRNPSVAEHSVIHGDPLVYDAGHKRRRYYWVRPGIDGAEWLCLEFGARDVKFEEGHGPPFLSGG